MTIRDFAMEVDRRGRDFYREMARRADSAAARGVLERLAEDAERLLEEHRRLEATGVEVDAKLLKDEQEIFRHHLQTAPADEVGAYRLALAVEGEVCRLFEGAVAPGARYPGSAGTTADSRHGMRRTTGVGSRLRFCQRA